MTQISSYFAKVSVAPDLAALKKVDRYLNQIEAKLRAFKARAQKANGLFNIRFKINSSSLQIDMRKAFRDVSRRISFPITRFSINSAQMLREMREVMRRVSLAMRGFRLNIEINANVGAGLRNQIRAIVIRAVRDAFGGGGGPGPRPGGGGPGGSGARAGGIAGLVGRYGAPAFLGGSALYGGAALNRANQEAMSMRLTTQAVVQAAGGTEKQGVDAFAWLRNLGNEVGFSYKEAAPDYNQFLANAQGAGLSIGQGQNIFQGLSEYQTAMGVTPARRKLVMNAASQMLGKQTLSMEELRRQMAESLPG